MSGLTAALYEGNPQDGAGATSESVERHRTQARRTALALVTLATSLVLLPVAGVDAPPSVKIATIEAGESNALTAPHDVKPATIQVVDAHGKQVGNVVGATALIGPGARATVALRVEDREVLLDVVAGNSVQTQGGTVLPFHGDGGENLLFEGADCSGQPLIPKGGTALATPNPAVVAPPGMTLYVPTDPAAIPSLITIRSFINVLGLCGTGNNPPSQGLVVPATPLIDLLTVYTPPFRIVFADTVAGGGPGITATIHLPGCTLTIQGGIIVDATSTIPFTGGTCP
jgi:hypothetical protein